jgi:hypothetical protein
MPTSWWTLLMSAHRKELILAITDIGRRKFSMTNTLRLEMNFGSRALLRDDRLYACIVGDPRRHETMTLERIDALRAGALHRTLPCAIEGLRCYLKILSRFPATLASPT